MDTIANNEEIGKKWIKYFNQRDLDALLGLYNANAVHYSPKLKVRKPETEGKIKGKETLREWWKDCFERYCGNEDLGLCSRLPSLSYEPVTYTANKDRVFIEYIRRVENEPGIFKSVVTEIDMLICEGFDISDGTIIYSRVYHG